MCICRSFSFHFCFFFLHLIWRDLLRNSQHNLSFSYCYLAKRGVSVDKFNFFESKKITFHPILMVLSNWGIEFYPCPYKHIDVFLSLCTPKISLFVYVGLIWVVLCLPFSVICLLPVLPGRGSQIPYDMHFFLHIVM